MTTAVLEKARPLSLSVSPALTHTKTHTHRTQESRVDVQCAFDISIGSANNHFSHEDTHTHTHTHRHTHTDTHTQTHTHKANTSSLVSHVCVNQIRVLHHCNQPHMRRCQNQLHLSPNTLLPMGWAVCVCVCVC